MDEKGMAANRRLAELLGWTEIVNVGGAWLGRPPGGAPASREQARVPDWSVDWAACGPLQASYVRRLRVTMCRVLIGIVPNGPGEHDHVVERDGSESRDQMIRRAIVAAVTAHLEARQ